ncbi:hypothetical protein [Mesorhizobium sp.]|uniref:hypothetical protein n=1 Tax=Mesorhizobium sp. TaxID=1871066 RepID=UPI002600BC32|nr:hypothetical protein [Mesorhizobium sp.]
MQQARAQAGYASPSDAARALRDINKNTLISHENGNRPLSRKANGSRCASTVRR